MEESVSLRSIQNTSSNLGLGLGYIKQLNYFYFIIFIFLFLWSSKAIPRPSLTSTFIFSFKFTFVNLQMCMLFLNFAILKRLTMQYVWEIIKKKVCIHSWTTRRQLNDLLASWSSIHREDISNNLCLIEYSSDKNYLNNFSQKIKKILIKILVILIKNVIFEYNFLLPP